jgi:hypothetical protein
MTHLTWITDENTNDKACLFVLILHENQEHIKHIKQSGMMDAQLRDC